MRHCAPESDHVKSHRLNYGHVSVLTPSNWVCSVPEIVGGLRVRRGGRGTKAPSNVINLVDMSVEDLQY